MHDATSESGGPTGPVEGDGSERPRADVTPGGAGVAHDPTAGVAVVPQVDDAPVEPRAMGLVVRPTGHDAVDARLGRLTALGHLAVGGHLEVYEDVHRGLRSTLTALDQHDSGS